ncbi:YadA-like family protein [Pseudomonas koreensis]|uniref:YadA-like family protein n=1 Tax=Pseudomonas koreensis TaxID=198620 RepID=UPI0014784DE5|nr:YadA-like family protein [Pseudomonas koreensis]
MNRAHSVVWNASLQCLVVVSELAKRGSKFSSVAGYVSKVGWGGGVAGRAAFPALYLGMFLFFSENASAITYNGTNANPYVTCVQSGPTVDFGGRIFAPSTQNPVNGSGLNSNIAGCDSTGTGSVLTTVFGSYSTANNNGASVFGVGGFAEKWASALGLAATARGVGSTAVGFGATANNLNSVAIGGAGGDGVTALGVLDATRADGVGAVAIGSNVVRGARASAAESIAIGGESTVAAAAFNGVAIGRNAQVTLPNSVAIGVDSSATAVSSTASNTVANSIVSGNTLGLNLAPISGVVGVGRRQIQGVADGQLSNTSSDAVNGSQLFTVGRALNTNTSNLGTSAASALGGGSAYNSTTAAWTAPSFILSSGTFSSVGTALSNMDNRGTRYFKSSSTGNASSATGANSVAIGSNIVSGASALGAESIAIGGQSTVAAAAFNGVAIGKNAQVTLPNSVAIGVDSSATAVSSTASNTVANSIVSGNTLGINLAPIAGVVGVGRRQIQSVADGQLSNTSSDAVNGSQLFTVGRALNTNTSNLGTSAASALGGGSAYNSTTAAWTAPSFILSSGTFSSVGTALSNMDDRGTRYFKSSSTGNASSATGVNSIAIGPASVASQQNAVALGFSARSTGSNAIAIGANSLATGSVAVGNLALAGGGGSAFGDNSDAGGTPSSLNPLVTEGTALGNSAVVQVNDGVALGSSSIANVASGISGFDPSLNTFSTSTSPVWQSTLGAVSVGGNGNSRQITGVAAGTFDTDVVNVAQLKSLDTKLGSLGSSEASNLGGGSSYDPITGVVSAPSYSVQGDTYNSVGGAIDAVDGNLTTLNDGINSGSVGVVQRTLTPDETVLTALGGTAAAPGVAQKLSNLANGTVSSTSSDAVNGSQLFTTNNVVSSLGSSAASNLGGGSSYDPITGVVSAPSYSVQGDTYNSVGGAIDAVDGNLTTLNDGINSGSVGVVQRTLTPDETVLTALGGTAAAPGVAQKLSNLADGTVSSTSSDAVNGSQLFSTNQQVSLNTGAITNLDGRVTTLSYTVDNISNGGGVKFFHANSMGADSIASGVNSIAIGPGATASGSSTVAIGNDSTASGNGSLALGKGASAISAGSVALGEGSNDDGRGAQAYTGKYSGAANTTSGTVSVGNSASGQTRTISNVSDGREATDAVNLRQLDGAVAESKSYTDQSLRGVSDAVTGIGSTISDIDNRVTQVQGSVSSLQTGNDGMFQVNSSSSKAKPRAIGDDSVAGGTGAVATGKNSTAIGSQAKAGGVNAVALGNSSNAAAANSVAIGTNSLADRENSVSVGSAGNERKITNVAAATQGTDAVNFDQLNRSVSASTEVANAYTNERYSELKSDLKKQDDTLSAGIAGAMAMASLPQPYSAGASMTSLAAANYRGQSAISFGFSRISDNGRWVTKLQANTNTKGDAGIAAGVGYQW